MANIWKRITKKKQQKTIAECKCWAVEEAYSDECYGGFKEYKPPIYEHQSPTATRVHLSDLFHDFNQK